MRKKNRKKKTTEVETKVKNGFRVVYFEKIKIKKEVGRGSLRFDNGSCVAVEPVMERDNFS